MQVKENVANMIRQYKIEHKLSLYGLSEELGMAPSSVQSYLNKEVNPRLDTLVQLAKKMDTSLMELISGPTPEWERTAAIVRAAREFSGMSPEQREKGIQLFLSLVDLFSQAE